MKFIWITIFCISLFGCDGDPYSGFGAVCTEGHPAVAHARSLSQEKLKFLYEEIFRLRETNKDTRIEYGHHGEPIPTNLQFLNAVIIRPNDYEPSITLAGCMDEFIFLRFDEPNSKNPSIVLSWAAGTNDNPYATGSQVLWSIKK